MFDFKDFEKQHSRIMSFAWIGTVIGFLLSLLLIGAVAYGCYELVSYVLEHGLKGLVEVIWNGS